MLVTEEAELVVKNMFENLLIPNAAAIKISEQYHALIFSSMLS